MNTNHQTMISWDIYEIQTNTTPIHGVKLRGRIRKFALQNQITLLTENATDAENTVRFALLKDESPKQVEDYLKSIISDVIIAQIKQNIKNPVLSKLKVNLEKRYE